MTDLFLPLNPVPNEVEWRMLDNSGVNGAGPWGATQTISRPGNRWACRLTWTNLRNADRHKLMAFVASLAGRANRAWIVDVSANRRGTMSAPELFTNADFSNGTTGWTPSNATLTNMGGAIRLTATTSGINVQFYQAAVVTTLIPYALRSFLRDGSRTAGLSIGRFISNGVDGADNDYGTARGLGTKVAVPTAGSDGKYPIVFASSSGFTAGDFADVLYTSLARCLLVDNGPNGLTYSKDFSNAAWTKVGCSCGNSGNAAPDGLTDVQYLLEDTSTGPHYVVQATGTTVSSDATDCAYSVSIKAGLRGWVLLQIQETTGSTNASCYFNSTTGAIGTIVTGANWSNVRAFSVAQGNGYFRFSIVARKTNAATGIKGNHAAATADNVSSYTGSSASNALYHWGASIAASSVPIRLTQTTSAAAAAAAQTGSALYVKGGPASMAGALAAGDMVEVITGSTTQMLRLTADLDFDAAGLGYMQFEHALRVSPADNAAIIVEKPAVKMMLNEDAAGWPTRPGMFSDFSLEFVEAIT